MNMGQITIKVNDEIEEKFRQTVGKVKGAKKGSMGQAIEEAMELWIKQN